MFHPPELERSREHDRFDPIREGERYGLSRELSLATWKRVSEDATDTFGRRNENLAHERFHELAARIAARGGRLRPDPGRLTRVDVELSDNSPGTWAADELMPRVPGRQTLAAIEARRWAKRVGEAARADELGGDSLELRSARLLRPRTPGRETLGAAFEGSGFGFDDYRVLGLKAMLQRLGLDHPRRSQVLAAAATADRSIAERATHWLEQLPIEATPEGQALWAASERHAATLYRLASSDRLVDEHDPDVQRALQTRGAGAPLPRDLRRDMERELGVPLSEVRLHTDAVAAAAARALDAAAFAIGEDIFFAEGAFAPDTRAGRKLIAHELAHVAQALRGDRGPAGEGLRLSLPGDPSEREADVVAERFDRSSGASPPTAGIQPAEPSHVRHHSSVMELFAPPHDRGRSARGGPAIQRQPKGASSPAAAAAKLVTGDMVVAVRISGSKVVIRFLLSGTYQYALTETSLAPRSEPYHGTGKAPALGTQFTITDFPGKVVLRFRGNASAPDPTTFKYADAFLVTVDDGSQASAAGGGDTNPLQAGDSTAPTVQVTDPRQIEILKQKGVLPGNQADQIAKKLKGGGQLTFEEALALVDALERSTSPGKTAANDNWLEWARFIAKNKDRIAGKSKTGKPGDETQAVLDEYKTMVGVKDPPTTTLKVKIEDARKSDPQVARAWNALSAQEQALWNAYLKDYGSSTRTTAERRTDLHPTTDDKLLMALNISAEYMPAGAAAQMKVLVNDPIFWASLMAGLTVYLLLWMAPEPIFTKATAILTTITILSLTGFAASQIIAVARAYTRLRDACAAATTIDEIRAAARDFGTSLGAVGANVLVTLALLLGGKALPARPPGGLPPPTPELMPAPATGPAVASPLPPPPVAAGATAGASSLPGYAIAVTPQGRIVYLTAKATQATGGAGGPPPGKAPGESGPTSKPEVAPGELPPESPEAVTTKATNSTAQGEFVKGTAAHRAARWAEYQQRGGTWEYERWEKVYEANMVRAERANAAVRAYRDKLGWGETEVTVEVEGVPRRLDIAEVGSLRAVEVKTGAQYATQDNLWEIARDEILMKKLGWDIKWHFEGTASQPLLDALKAAGIPVQ